MVATKQYHLTKEKNAELDEEIKNPVGSELDFKEKSKFLMEVPGVSPKNAATLIAEVLEPENADRRQIAALLGLVHAGSDSRQSGHSHPLPKLAQSEEKHRSLHVQIAHHFESYAALSHPLNPARAS